MSLVSLLLIQSHCSSDPECSSRVQISSQPDPQTPSGALIHVPRYLGNLPFRVWKKMQDIVQNSESDCRRSELAYTHTGNDAILTDFSIMCEEPDHLLHQNQQLNFRKGVKSTQKLNSLNIFLCVHLKKFIYIWIDYMRVSK